jgi:hypothetical protein
MFSSGIKRGLAVSAISALAVSGAPFLTSAASAATVTSTIGANNVNLYSQFTGIASPRNDGVNTTVHLVAGGGANVSQVRFEYVVNGTATQIALVSKTAGVFSTEWTPTAALLGQTVTVRAVGVSSVGTDLQLAQQQVTVDANAPSVDIGTAPGASVGIFNQVYGIEAQEAAGQPGNGIDHSRLQGAVSGTTSGTAVTLSNRTPSAPNVAAAGLAATVAAPNANGVSTYRGAVNFRGYTTTAGTDEAVVGAAAGPNGSDDAEVVTLKQQRIASVTSAATPAQVASTSTGSVVVTVLDQDGLPVTGAQVINDLDGDGVWDGGAAGGTETSAYTDANGQATFSGLAGGRAYSFFVNVDGDDNFDTMKDFRTAATIASYSAVATTVVATSADGAAFDVDEYTPGDLAVTVRDQTTAGLAGQQVTYELSAVPFTTTPATPAPATVTAVVTTGADGRAVIPFVPQVTNATYTLKTYINRDGVPGQGTGDLSGTDLVFKAGDSTLAFAKTSPVVSPAGGSDTYDATLRLADGTPLVGRLVTFTYRATGNVVVASQANQPTGTTRLGDTQATDVTDANGTVTVALADPAAPAQAELNGRLSAETSTNSIGNAREAAGPIQVDFVTSVPPSGSTVVIDTDNVAGQAAPTYKPGRAVTPQRLVVTAPPAAAGGNRVPVEGVAVQLTVSNGFFTDGSADPAAAIGADAGELRSLGTTITVVTNNNGVARFSTAIERDTGFDDDGLVTAVVTASTGTAASSTATSDTEDYVYNSSDPLNGGAVTLVQSPAALQESSVLPRAQAGDDDVFFDVFTTDQFGNRVGGEVVNLTDNSAAASISSASATSDFAADGDFSVAAASAVDDTVTASWTTDTFRYNAALQAVTTANGETLTDAKTINFYAIDYAASTYTLTNSGAATQPVGTVVTVTFRAVDQFGQGINNLDVDFFRTGPDDLQDGNPQQNQNGVTNSAGSLTYSYQGAKAGAATVSTLARVNGTQVPQAAKTNTVTFVVPGTTTPTIPTTVPATPTTPALVDALIKLKGLSRGNTDVVKVNAVDAAAGAKVTVIKKVNGKKTTVGSASLNAKGNKTFKSRDTNGRGKTRYIAKISATAKTAAKRVKFNLS